MSYIIATDSSSNIPREIVKKLEIPVLPFHYTMDGEEYRETLLEEEVQRRAFFAAMRINVEVKTSLINFNEFEEFFEPFLKEGKDLLYIGMSSGISSTFNNAEMAAEELREAYPDRKIELVDTKNASLGEGLPVLRAYAMRDEGKDIETVAEALRDLVPRMRGSFMVDDIMYLKHTGRVSGVVAVAGKALGIRPLLRGDDDGHIVQAGRSRGKKAALNALSWAVEEMEKIIEDYFDLCNKKHLPYTVSGLAIALDMTRETLLRYEEQNEFSDTIKRAKQRVEGYAEMCLFRGGGIATGVIFSLKNNFGWKDKTEIDNNIGNKDDKPFKNIDLSHLTTEQIKELLKNEDQG